MLEIKNVSKSYGALKAVDNLSFSINEGEIFGLLGVNGAGKTTTFRMINSLLIPDEGTITLNGQDMGYDITNDIGFLTEERSLLLKLTVLEQAKYYGILKGMKEADIEPELEKWLERFGIADFKMRPIKELSKGNQQKVQFAISILHNPKLLILDEPFSGLDPLNVELFKSVIRELSGKGTSIIFSTHQMGHVEEFCKKILILLRGKTVLEGNIKDIKEQYGKKNIIIDGDVDKYVEELKNSEGIVSVTDINGEWQVKIDNKKYVKDVFNKIKSSDNITKFVVEEPSLNEIFVAKAGEKYEE